MNGGGGEERGIDRSERLESAMRLGRGRSLIVADDDGEEDEKCAAAAE